MPLTVTMPQLGESVTEGTIGRWLKHPGDHVTKYESIAEVITDKVNAEIPAPADGVMAELIAPEGAVVAVGQPICSIETGAAETDAPAPSTGSAQAEAPAPARAEAPAAEPGPPASATPEPEVPAQPAAAPAASPQPEPAATPAQLQPAAQAVAAPAGGNGAAAGYHLTPAVRMLLREHAVDVAQIQGSGLGGRVTKKDVLEYVQRRDAGQLQTPAVQPTQVAPAATPVAPSAGEAPAPAAPVFAAGDAETVVPLSGPRKAIAEHMVRSKFTAPHAYVMVEVNMASVYALRSRAKAEFEQRYGVKLTFLPFVARAVCEALRRHPTLNASWSEQGIVVKRDINLGIAVALEDNLVVPVVRNADRLSIAGLATTMADLGARARSNHLKLDEIQGGTFTLNNTGALGAVLTQAIINQPQAAIMTMDLVVKRPVVVEADHIAIRPMMNLGMSFDHRINDGLQATRFVKSVQELLEGFDETAPLL
jgi:2-oxoisovalerate dehydrogenase E2 component (dihydrolipoyl transacylase)